MSVIELSPRSARVSKPVRRNLFDVFDDSTSPSSHSTSVSTVKRPRLSEANKQEMVFSYRELKKSPNVKRGAFKALAQKYGVSGSTIRRMSARREEPGRGGSLEHLPRSGRPKFFTPAKAKLLRTYAKKRGFKLSSIKLTSYLQSRGEKVSDRTVQRHIKQEGWRHARLKAIPKLTEAHKKNRLTWAQRHRKHQWTCHVDIDEKYFEGVSLKSPLLIPRNETPQKVPLQHKSHVPKIMVLCAVARPSALKSFDGKIGLWPVTEKYEAKRRSKNHEQGDTYNKYTTMNGERFTSMMKKLVVPSIRKKMSWCKVVTVQMDNAPPHISLKQLEEEVNSRPGREGPRIRLITQTPMSPDMNVLDLGLFNSLSTRVSQLQTTVEDGDDLMRSIRKAWKELPATTIEKCFESKSRGLKRTIKFQGGNNFNVPHS